jgi:hypothetical protein
MPPFLKIGSKYIAPAHILSIVVSNDYTMLDGMEVERAKARVNFPDHTEDFYGADAAILLKWLSDYALNASAYHTSNHAR